MIPGTPTARCRESLECREKMITRAQRARSEAGGELWEATAAWEGQSWRRRHGWEGAQLGGELSEQPTRQRSGGTAADSPAKWRTVIRQKNAVAARKGRDDSGGVRVTPPGDGCMVPQVTKSSVGGVRLGRMAAPRRQKRRAAAGRPPERHHSGPRPRLRGR